MSWEPRKHRGHALILRLLEGLKLRRIWAAARLSFLENSAVKLAARRDDLPVTAVDEFLGEHVIGHIPGSGPRDPHEEPGSS